MKLINIILLKLSAIGALITLTSSAIAGNEGTIIFVPVNANGDPTAVPTLSAYMLIILSLLLFAVAFRVSKKKGAGKLFTLMLGASVLMASTGGVKLISDVQAVVDGIGPQIIEVTNPEGSPENIIPFQYNPYANTSGVPLKIDSIMLPTEGSCPINSIDPQTPIVFHQICVPGLVLPTGDADPATDANFCEIDCNVSIPIT